MRERWQQLEKREQLFLVGGAVIISLLLLYGLLWLPLTRYVDTAQSTLMTDRALLQWMQKKAPLLHKAQQSNSQKAPLDVALSVMLNDTLQTAGLDAFNPTLNETDNAVQVSFERVSFDRLMAWLMSVDTHYIVHINQVSIQRIEPDEGMVNARLTLS